MVGGFKQLRWIVFEGIDGSGKTTQAQLFSDFLSNNGVANEYRHVFDTHAGKVLRDLFIDSEDLGNRMEILLLAGARDQFIHKVVLKEIKQKLLITDRFFFSIEAMQGLHNQEDLALIHYLKSIILRDIQPDLHILIDVPAQICHERMLNHSKSKDRIESKGVDFHEQVRQAYVQIYNSEHNTLMINGNQSIPKVHSDIVEAIKNWITNRSEWLETKAN